MKIKHYLLAVSMAGFISGEKVTFSQAPQPQELIVVSAVAPTYPPISLDARITGDVTVVVEINREGQVTSAKPYGHKLLQKSAEGAARGWVFTASRGGPEVRTARLVFSYRIPDDKQKTSEQMAVFMPPYRVIVYRKPEHLRPGY